MPRAKAKTCIPRGAQGEQVRRQRLDIEQGLAGKFLFTGGHGVLPSTHDRSVSHCGPHKHRRFVVFLAKHLLMSDYSQTHLTTWLNNKKTCAITLTLTSFELDNIRTINLICKFKQNKKFSPPCMKHPTIRAYWTLDPYTPEPKKTGAQRWKGGRSYNSAR
ncbi:hypothetical protein EMIT0P218_90206 [Pseudomonas sp. IT-P218]